MLRRGEGISGYDRRILTGPVGHADIEMTAEVSEAAAYPLRRCKTIHLVTIQLLYSVQPVKIN